jgi:hypothetical protein
VSIFIIKTKSINQINTESSCHETETSKLCTVEQIPPKLGFCNILPTGFFEAVALHYLKILTYSITRLIKYYIGRTCMYFRRDACDPIKMKLN